jgi:hypothetical protein
VTVLAAERSTVVVALDDCEMGAPDCAALAEQLHAQLSTGAYTWPCSLMPVPASRDEWEAEHRTARKRAWAAERAGYTFAEVDRSQFADDIHDINTSKPERQGRPMSAGYLTRQEFSPLPDYPCARHAIRTYGVTDADGFLRAYTVVYRVGQLVMFSQILGHAGHLHRGIMFLLARDALAAQAADGDGYAFYNRHDSGQPGLVWMKERVGFLPTRVEWSLT